jgi:hypothetical protein
MLAFLAAIAAIIQELIPLAPAIVGVGTTIASLWNLGNEVVASGGDPTHDQWAALVGLQSAALAQVKQSPAAPTAANG